MTDDNCKRNRGRNLKVRQTLLWETASSLIARRKQRDLFDQKLAERGIEMFTPHKRNLIRAVTQNGRKLLCTDGDGRR